jgi:hypothetical protein
MKTKMESFEMVDQPSAQFHLVHIPKYRFICHNHAFKVYLTLAFKVLSFKQQKNKILYF